MKCPKCGSDQTCGCDSCVMRHGHRSTDQLETEHDCLACPNCGLEMHLDQWLDFDYGAIKLNEVIT